MNGNLLKLIMFCGIVFLAISCTRGAGEGSVGGSVSIPSCNLESDDWQMEVNFFTAEYFENSLFIRLQRSGNDEFYTDGLLLFIRDVDFIAESGPETIHEIVIEPSFEEFAENGLQDGEFPETTLDSPARATLYLNHTCPENGLAFTDGFGTFTIEHIYQPSVQKRIKGSFQLMFVDPRFWNSPDDFGPFADVSGDFDFNYLQNNNE